MTVSTPARYAIHSSEEHDDICTSNEHSSMPVAVCSIVSLGPRFGAADARVKAFRAEILSLAAWGCKP